MGRIEYTEIVAYLSGWAFEFPLYGHRRPLVQYRWVAGLLLPNSYSTHSTFAWLFLSQPICKAKRRGLLLPPTGVDVDVGFSLSLGQPWSFECWRSETEDCSGFRDGVLLAWHVFGMRV